MRIHIDVFHHWGMTSDIEFTHEEALLDMRMAL